MTLTRGFAARDLGANAFFAACVPKCYHLQVV